MEQRENRIRLWFEMWLKKEDLGLLNLFTRDAVYIESWGPEYRGAEKIRHWFNEWNTRGTVLQWDIRQFFHKADMTVAEWYFKNNLLDGRVEAFDGISLVRWSGERICLLQEFGCNKNRYDPYRNGPAPQFQGGPAAWF